MASIPKAKISDCSPRKITYPQEWSDRDRMNYLLAPFPLSDQSLPLDDPKFSFWSSFILSSSRELHSAIVTAKDIEERLKWNEQIRPSCIDAVLEGMERRGDAVKLSDFYSQTTVTQGWLSWSASVVKRPLSWAMKTYLPASKYEGGYVLSSIARDFAAVVMDGHRGRVLYKSTDNIMKYSDFEKLCTRSFSKEMVPVVTQQLLLNGQLVKAKTRHGYEVVKLSSEQASGLKVTETDIGIVSIKETVDVLTDQIKQLEERIASLRQSAKQKLNNKDKKGAMRYLRQSMARKLDLEKKESMLDSVQNLLHKIESAETDAMVYETYKSGVEAIRQQSRGLTLEKVEDVIADMREAVEDSEDISAALSEGLPRDDLEDDELLLELENLTAQDKEPVHTAEDQEESELAAHMASLSVSKDSDRGATTATLGNLLDQFPPVPTNPVPVSSSTRHATDNDSERARLVAS